MAYKYFQVDQICIGFEIKGTLTIHKVSDLDADDDRNSRG